MKNFWDAYQCPQCGEDFVLKERSLICSNQHSFDISKEGYVNFIAANKKKSLISGDGKEMIQARDQLLHTGIYNFLADRIVEYLKTNSHIHSLLEIGCGSGFYLYTIAQKLGVKNVYGTDISKEAVKFCAKKYGEYFFSVQNSFDFHFQKNFFDVIFSIFSPFDLQEIEEILAHNGRFVMVRAGSSHLHELYKIFGKDLHEKNIDVNFKDLEIVHNERLITTAHPDAATLELLIKMSPLFWTFNLKDKDIHNIDCPDLTLDFHLCIFQKKTEKI